MIRKSLVWASASATDLSQLNDMVDTTLTREGSLREWRPFSIWRLAGGYFAAYLLYAALVKVAPQTDWHWPSLLIGVSCICLPALLLLTHRARSLSFETKAIFYKRRIGAFLMSGMATALIAITTLLIIGAASLDILTALVLMRGGVLLLGPVWDHVVNRAPTSNALFAMGLCVAAVCFPLLARSGAGALGTTALPLALYLAGYAIRIGAMSHHAKRSEPALRAVWLAWEILVCLIVLGAALMIVSPINPVERVNLDLSHLAIGAAYGLVLLFGSLIYLDPSDNSYAIPINRASSLLAGLFLSLALFVLGRVPESPTFAALMGGGFLISALWLLYRDDTSRKVTR